MASTANQLRLLEIRSLIVEKEMVVATANRELALGGWLSDHQSHIVMLNGDIAAIVKQINTHEE